MRLTDLPSDARVYELFARRPELFEPFTLFCERLMRGPSPLTPARRELIGAFVSALNACAYCRDVHAEAVRALGADPALVRALRDDPDGVDVEPDLRALLTLARKITETPQRVTDGDLAACRAAGCDEEAIHDAVVVTCLFNFMNRLVSAFGIEADAAYIAAAGPRLREHGYAASLAATSVAGRAAQDDAAKG